MPRATSTLFIRLLGDFAVRIGEAEFVTVKSKKARGLLAYLGLAPNYTASRELLAGLLWPESGEKEARQSLRQCLTKLRRDVGEVDGDWLVTEGNQVQLHQTNVSIDVSELAAACKSEDGARMAEVAPLASGLLLPNDRFGGDEIDDWLRDERVRQQSLCRRLLLACASEQLDPKVREETYWQLLSFDPACEEAHRGLMQVHAASGQRSSALQQYRACEDALLRHMDTAPSAATRQLYEELRDAEAVPASPPVANPDEAQERTLPLPLPPKPSIMVLMFKNLSGDPANDYLCEGISEDITTFLSQFSALQVMSRTAAAALRDTALPIAEVGWRLGVHFVLDGSVRVAGSRVRVTVQLAEAERGTQIWANRYDGTLEDVFSFQDDISQRVVATTAGRIEAQALERARRKQAKDMTAYDLVLRGKYHHHRCTPDDSAQAVEHFQQALEHDPDWPLAKGWLVCAVGRAQSFQQTRTQWMNSDTYKEMMAKAVGLMEEGLGVDPEESECLRLFGEVHLFQRKYDLAERCFRQAHQYNPNDDRILSQLAAFLTYIDQAEEAIEFARQSIRINPYHPGFYRFNLGRALMCTGDYAAAAEELAAASPRQAHWRPYLAACYHALGQVAERDQIVEEVFAAEPHFGLNYLKATMLFRSPERLEALFALMEAAGLPRESTWEG